MIYFFSKFLMCCLVVILFHKRQYFYVKFTQCLFKLYFLFNFIRNFNLYLKIALIYIFKYIYRLFIAVNFYKMKVSDVLKVNITYKKFKQVKKIYKIYSEAHFLYKNCSRRSR